MVEIEAWIPLSVATITIVAGMGAYAWNKKIDRNHALIELRRSLYRDFIFSIIEVSESNNGQNELAAYRKKLVELHLLGSDEVIRACEDFISLYRSEKSVGKDERALRFARLEMAMRRDCYEKTEITVQELKLNLPVKF
jgi:hypothetical protein